MVKKARVDKQFLGATIILAIFGFLIFYSASLGLILRQSASYSSITFSQTVLGLLSGAIAMFTVMWLDFRVWRKSAFILLVAALILNALVLVPSIGFEHGGARRWFDLGPVSFQPAELLKLAFVIYFAAWISQAKDKIKTLRDGLIPLLILFGISGGLLLAQPDTANFALIVFAGLAMFIAGGGKWRHLFLMVLIGALGLAILAYSRPYIMKRITTFINPQTADSQREGYQIRQSLIAIGSGGLLGRGFGQSVQKSNFLPEPVGDSIFAVAAEEFGFVGATALVALFVFFATRGLKVASRVSDSFGRLVIVGIVIMIVSQAFVNIGAMLGVIPLSGITLPFVSHGGTSLFFTLFSCGIVLSISRIQRQK
jgi:cell division protein FtsW